MAKVDCSRRGVGLHAGLRRGVAEIETKQIVCPSVIAMQGHGTPVPRHHDGCRQGTAACVGVSMRLPVLQDAGVCPRHADGKQPEHQHRRGNAAQGSGSADRYHGAHEGMTQILGTGFASHLTQVNAAADMNTVCRVSIRAHSQSSQPNVYPGD